MKGKFCIGNLEGGNKSENWRSCGQKGELRISLNTFRWSIKTGDKMETS